VSEPKPKSFEISRRAVWEAYRRVKANKGAAGVDEQSIEEFEQDLSGNLYKLWNRLSSGTYFPPPVRAVEIPKRDGSSRVLGVPTVADRIAQTVVRLYLEPSVEPVFYEDSYGYRPGRSAHDALGVCRERCWRNDWVLDMDIRKFFDSVSWDLTLKAVAHHSDQRWIVLYVQRWLKAPLQTEDGSLVERDRGTPRVRRSHRCSPTCSCTTRSMRGWLGSIRAFSSSAIATTSSSTLEASDRPCSCGP
jgi:RNA-directed DNA polymerase